MVIDPIGRLMAMLPGMKANSPRNTRDIQYGLQRTGMTCTRSLSHTGYLAHGNSKGEARGRNRHKNHRKRVVRNLKERNVDTIRGEKSQTRLNYRAP